ncbi:MAG: hypothetical protein D6692_02840 [Planctomycetota bacterium]|nr:MAG: hypothetical protein D6692_02840 [Planctomycetota bacterium]
MITTPPAKGWIDRFLGPAAAEGGPFALLGLPHEVSSHAQIADAVRRRLQAVDAHPLRLTPEADEVRLAIHTAAAQLADPALRTELAKRFPPGKPAAMPRAWQTHLRRLTPQLKARARHIIGASGGWNRKAKTRLAMIARQHRISAIDLVREIRPRPSSAATRAIKAPAPPPPIPWPVPSGRAWLTIHALLLVLLAVISGVTIAELLRPAPPPPKPSVRASSPSEPKPTLSAPPIRSEFAHFSAMEQELANAARSAQATPEEAGRRAARVLAAFLDNWTQIPADARARLVARLAWFAAPDRAGQQAGPALSAAAPTPAARAMADTIKTFAASEPMPQPDPAAIDRPLIERLRAALDEPAGHPPAWWQSWTEAVRACTGVRQDERETLILQACTHIISRPSATRDTVGPIARVLAASVPWRAGDPSRVWLLQRLEDPDMDPDALAAFVRVLATEVSVPGINPADTLPSAPTMARRERLADALRAAWSDLRPPPTPLEAELIDAFRAALTDTPDVSDPLSTMRAIEHLVRLNAAAALEHAGDDQAAAERIADAFIPLATRDPVPSPPTDPTLGIQLLNASSDDQAADILREIARNPLSAGNADALVETAVLGRSRDVREQARQIVLINESEPLILLALERRIRDRTRGTVLALAEQVLGSAPPNDDPNREQHLREALLIRAAERSPGIPSDLRYLELQIDEHLAARAGLPTGEPAPVSIAALIESLTNELTAAGVVASVPASAPITLGTAPALAARQRELVKLIAMAMHEETALWKPLTDVVLADLERDWRSATTASEQVLAAQRAEARLWLLRLEGLP